jgi:acetyltransferase
MTVRNLDAMFRPRSIALIGASQRENSVGAVLARNLFQGGFDGPVMPVNPKHTHIQSVPTYPDIHALPSVPDLAIVATPPDAVPGLIAELGALGTKAAVVITAGFGEGDDPKGRALMQTMLDASKPHLLRIVGPNCLGILVPALGLNASFAETAARPGRLAFVAQSGAVVTSVIDWATSRGIGFSHLVSLGAMSDVDLGDMLDYLANQREARAILMYIEAVTNTRKFMSAARAAARSKPVIVVKAGRHAEGARAVASHTGALAGSDEVYDTAFRRAGMLRVFSLEELFDAVSTLGTIDLPKGDRLTILTNGGGMGVLATDALIDEGGSLAELSAPTRTALDKVLPPTWSRANPIDIIGDADGARYASTLAHLMEDRSVDAVLVLHCPTAIASSLDAAQSVVDTVKDRKSPTVLTSWIGGDGAVSARRLFAERRIPTFETPSQAARAFMHMVTYRHNQQTLMETPPSVPEDFTPDTAKAREIIDAALRGGRTWLSDPQAKAVIAAYAIPVAGTHVAESPKAAAEITARLGGAVALKILSPDITHKTDVGGVVLNLEGPRAVEAAAAAMLDYVARERPAAKIEGFTVEPMVRRPGSYELIAGMSEDAQFGPTILFGQGGTAVEVVADRALALPPLNMRLAYEAMSRTRVYRLLRGYRGLAPVNLDAIALTLIKISQLVIDFAEIVELDINPLLADEYGVIALDARIRVAPASRPGTERLAIRPHPKELEEEIHLEDGRTLLLRPILPEDEPSLHKAFAKLTPEEIRLRFFVPMKTMTHLQAARFTQIDYDREMALILTAPGIPGQTEIFGVVRIAADPDNERAEYAIIVRHDFTGLGLGHLLMERIIAYAKGRGIGEIFGDVLRDNTTMLRLCDTLNFIRSVKPEEPDIVRVSLTL